MLSSTTRPRLRPVEAIPTETDGRPVVIVHDPAGLADGSMTVSPAVVFILSLMDGEHTLKDIEKAFAGQFGRVLPHEQLRQIVQALDASYFLDNERFAAYLQSKVDEYRSAPARVTRDAASFGAGDDGLAALVQEMLSACSVSSVGRPGRRLAGVIAPHLDYGRGAPCYADAYGLLGTADAPRRVVILGTNHAGRGASVVATRKDFQTPLGLTRTDRTFLERLEKRCSVDLCEHEFDHLREHSIELQVVILQHVLGADRFEIVPALCHDPSGPSGTAPHDGNGADLRLFGEALGELVLTDPTPTLVVAGADLSHVGRRFGDQCDLDEPFLRQIEQADRSALDAVVHGRRDEFVEILRRSENSTRICSVGSIYALMTALPDAHPELLSYHQAVAPDSQTCVTCSAMAFWE